MGDNQGVGYVDQPGYQSKLLEGVPITTTRSLCVLSRMLTTEPSVRGGVSDDTSPFTEGKRCPIERQTWIFHDILRTPHSLSKRNPR